MPSCSKPAVLLKTSLAPGITTPLWSVTEPEIDALPGTALRCPWAATTCGVTQIDTHRKMANTNSHTETRITYASAIELLQKQCWESRVDFTRRRNGHSRQQG